jgi:hypothetical protein
MIRRLARFVNWRRFVLLFAVFNVALLVCGCTAAWLGAIDGLLPFAQAAVTAIISFVLALEGKTISAQVSAQIQQIGQDISAEIANVQTLIAAAKQSTNQTIIGQIQAVLQSIVGNLANILSAANVEDSSTVAKITQLVGLAVAAFQAVLALVPVVTAALAHGTKAQLESTDKMATSAINGASKTIQETYKAIVAEHTPSSDVNTALDSLPRQL